MVDPPIHWHSVTFGKSWIHTNTNGIKWLSLWRNWWWFQGIKYPHCSILESVSRSRCVSSVRPEEGEFAAGLCDLADLHLKMSLRGKQLCMGGLVKWLQTQSIAPISLFYLLEAAMIETSVCKTVRNVGYSVYYLKFWRAVGVKGWKNSNDIWKVDEN